MVLAQRVIILWSARRRMPPDPHSEAYLSGKSQGEARRAFPRPVSALIASWRASRGGRLTTFRDRYLIAVLLSFLPFRLDWILRTFGSDKQRPGGHSYGSTYHALLSRFRYRPVKLLEVGVLSGDSLLSWRAFFPRGSIVGCDIQPKTEFNVGRIRTYLTDQSSHADLAKLCELEGPFDIIIEDGSHINEHQIFSFYELFPKLKDGGIYVAEDVQTSFWPGVFGGANFDDPAFAGTCVGELLELSKYLNHSEFLVRDQVDERRLAFAKQIKRIAFEHNLVIVWKGPNNDSSNLPVILNAFAKSGRDPAAMISPGGAT